MKNENTKISFRKMKEGEEAEVVDLVINVFMEFVASQFSVEGISTTYKR